MTEATDYAEGRDAGCDHRIPRLSTSQHYSGRYRDEMRSSALTGAVVGLVYLVPRVHRKSGVKC